MKRAARAFFTLSAAIDRVFKWVSIFLIGAMTLAVIFQVIARYIFFNPPSWTEELARYLMIWGSFVAMGHMVRNWKCVQVDFLVERLGPKYGTILKYVLRGMVFVFAVAMVLICIRVYPTVTRTQVTPAMNISMYWPTLGIVIGMILVSLQALASMCALVLGIEPEAAGE